MVRRFGFPVLAALVTLAVMELAALTTLVATHTYPEKPFAEMYGSSSCLKANEFNYAKYVHSRQGEEVMLGKVPHPFFGIVHNQEGEGLDYRRGQVGPDYENALRYSISLGRDPRPADVFTIGIFGASVAYSFAEHVMRNDDFADALRSRVPALRDRQIVIRNMAIGASRQPSQFAIAVHYLELFDMTLNLDGYSEQAITMYPEFPVEFPMFGDVFFGKSGESKYLLMRTAQAACKAISAPGQSPMLRYSNAYYLFWHVASRYLNHTFQERTPRAEPVESFPFSDTDVRQLYANYYEHYTRYQHQVLAPNGVHAYFFLQPNQYVAGSKPFSDEEKRTALGPDRETELRYPLLKQKIRSLAAEGIPAFDLTGIFNDVRETIYVDTCCHVNARGNDLIGSAIVDIIAREENAGRDAKYGLISTAR